MVVGEEGKGVAKKDRKKGRLEICEELTEGSYLSWDQQRL